MTRALILGVSGQDGGYLARHLLECGYEVHGSSRDKDLTRFEGLQRLGIRERVKLHSVALSDFRSVFRAITEIEPAEIYNLAGQSSVALSFDQPVETLDSTIFGPLNILECLRLSRRPARLYNACSSECFGNVADGAADETTPFRPRSPYAVGKAAAFWAVANYREAYRQFACSGILFNHDSPLRPRRFVTQKIIAGAADVAEGKSETLELGDLSVARDFGWAADYVEAMAAMLRSSEADDFVIATGETRTLADFAAAAFAWFGLDWRTHVRSTSAMLRPTDIRRSAGNPAKARAKLAWTAKSKMEDVINEMAVAELKLRKGETAL